MNYFELSVLENDGARLEPLSASHHDDLVEAVSVDDIWKTWYTRIPSPADMANTIALRLAMHAAGETVPWAIIDPISGRAVGMTSYVHLEPRNRRLEIGSTWIGRGAQGSGINPAAKFLLLERAFEQLDCIAVELRAHWHNRKSRGAIEKLGAKQDGVLRNHTVFENGTVRDTVVYSIIDGEWPTVRYGLEERMRASAASRKAARSSSTL